MSVPVDECGGRLPEWPTLIITLDDADAATIKEVSDGKWGIVRDQHVACAGILHLGLAFMSGGARHGGLITPEVFLTPRECVGMQVSELRQFATENDVCAQDGEPRRWDPTAAALRRAADRLEWAVRWHPEGDAP